MSQPDKSQKTLKPTPKRIKEFRKQGKVAISKDLTSMVSMLVGGAFLVGFAERSSVAVAEMMRSGMSAGESASFGEVASTGVNAFFLAVAPVMIGAFLGYVVAATLQLGWPPAFKKPSFKLGKVFQWQSISQLISPKAAAGRVAKATAKAGLIIAVVALTIHSEYEAFRAHPALEPMALGKRVLGAVGAIGLHSIAVLAALAAVDFVLQKRKLMAEMKMSPEEMKQEMKQSEGDPKVKGKRKQRAREMAQRRIQAEVSQADVVIVNPTHYSVALRYDSNKEGAPRVVAKGRDELAFRIREFARKAGVPILSRPPLTRFIYKLVPEGREIPADVYQAVAEILAYVYKLRAGVRGA